MKIVSKLLLVLPFTFLLVSQASAQQTGLARVLARLLEHIGSILNSGQTHPATAKILRMRVRL